jgi:DNA-binding response OmpR family regulator
MINQKILIADDDMDIVLLLRKVLEAEGYRVDYALNGNEVKVKVKDPNLSLVLLDIVMPGIDGLNVIKQIRDEISIPIIFLSAKDRELDKILGLELGADDYITKPFSVDEIVARVKSHIRRENRKKQELPPSSLFRYGALTINKDTYMAENKNRVLSREQIYEANWGLHDFGDLNTVTVHLNNIRLKMDPHHLYIKTVWGVGYKFVG